MKKIADILRRDPATYGLVNQGQARIVDRLGEKELAELREELSTFVCEGQFAEGIRKILRSYLDNQGRTSHKGVWVSGFYGSGKSHLLKMLCHLWQDTKFPDGSTARSLVPHIPEDILELFRELDIAGRRAGGLLAAAGSMPSGSTDNVRLTVLGIVLRAIGLPSAYPQARFYLWLQEQGWLESVKASLEKAGKVFEKEINALYVSPPLSKALLKCDPNLATSEAQLQANLRAQFPPISSDINTEDFLRTMKEALATVGKDGRLPCMLLILDELQQYIGQSHERSVLVTEVAEAVSKHMDTRVMIVGAGQNALTEVHQLQRLMDRFTIRVPLSDTDVETVTRKVLLQKKPAATAEVDKLLNKHGGEISRQLQGTRIAERQEDQAIIVDDYPLLPVRRRFWEHCFRQIDAEGTQSQLRSQLGIIHDAVASISKKEIGTVVPADELYDALAGKMVSTGVLLREINERILQIGKTEGRLAQRVCGLVFLIGKLKREAGSDIGVRSTAAHIADLLVDDLRTDNGKLRSDVEATLKKLADKGELMFVDEYRLQTREGSEWDRDYRNRQSKLNSDEAAIQFRRDQLLYAEADDIVRSVRITQGAATEPRKLVIHREPTPPVVDGTSIPVWIRDGWAHSEKEMVDAARTAGAESPIISVFIPRNSPQDLAGAIVEAEAAQQTLDARGIPTGPEGQEAMQSMKSRLAAAIAKRDRLIQEIVASAKVFQGGGSEVLSLVLDEKVRNAANDAKIRLFPRFKEADSGAWEAALRRAKDGDDHPLQPTGHTEATEKHPVCQQVLTTIGNGKTWSQVRTVLKSSPYGWPQDAIDAAVVALHRGQQITATLNSTPVPIGQLDQQTKYGKADLRVEQSTLSVQDRLIVRKLIQQLGVACTGGKESEAAPEFLRKLIELARSSGGDAPLPVAPAVTDLEDLQRLVGNEQLVAIKNQAKDLESKIKTWTNQRDLVAKRKPAWDLVHGLARQAKPIEEAKTHLEQVSAIEDQRMLLAATDPVGPLRLALAKMLRDSVNSTHEALAMASNDAMVQLRENEVWKKLQPEDQTAILDLVGFVVPAKPDVSTDERLLSHLDAKPISSAGTELSAIAGRLQQAIELAAKKLQPKVQPIILERTTLQTEADVLAWLERAKKLLTDAVKKGPVLVK